MIYVNFFKPLEAIIENFFHFIILQELVNIVKTLWEIWEQVYLIHILDIFSLRRNGGALQGFAPVAWPPVGLLGDALRFKFKVTFYICLRLESRSGVFRPSLFLLVWRGEIFGL